MRSVYFVGSAVALLLASACATQPPPVAAPVGAVVSGGGGAPSDVPAQVFASEDDAAVPISAADPVWGSRQAPVTMVVFGDFQCPFTAKVAPTIVALEQKYGPADLRVVWKERPLENHPNARPAAEAAEVVRKLGKSDAFWKFWETALAHRTELTAANFEAWAQAAGVDLLTFQHLVAAHDGAAKVTADLGVATRLEVTHTPTTLINGVPVIGSLPVDSFTTVIDAELAKAKAKLAGGVAPDRLYATLTAENWKAAAEAPEEEEKEDTTTVWNVPLGSAPVKGSAAAPVTIVEFSDFQCPFCKKVEPTLKELLKTYGDKVRLVWRDEPIGGHPRALPAAELAREARAEKGDAGFWAAHDALFDAQPALEDADLDRIAKALGLDAGKARSAVEKARYQTQIDRDTDLADDVEANGTPHFFINGRRLVGAQPIEKFRAIIDEELNHVAELVAKGTAPRAVYATIIKGGRGPTPPESKVVAPRAGAAWKGGAGGKVVIEEFADFQCPYCAKAEPTLQRIAKEYGTQVKFVWRNLPLPFHKQAALAAEAAAEAQHQKGNTAFWAMHDKLFAHRADNNADGSGLDRPALETYAQEIGLDLPRFRTSLDQHTRKAEIDSDVQVADAAHIGGAPTFLVGGYVVIGAQNYAKFRRVIEQVLADGPAKH